MLYNTTNNVNNAQYDNFQRDEDADLQQPARHRDPRYDWRDQGPIITDTRPTRERSASPDHCPDGRPRVPAGRDHGRGNAERGLGGRQRGVDSLLLDPYKREDGNPRLSQALPPGPSLPAEFDNQLGGNMPPNDTRQKLAASVMAMKQGPLQPHDIPGYQFEGNSRPAMQNLVSNANAHGAWMYHQNYRAEYAEAKWWRPTEQKKKLARSGRVCYGPVLTSLGDKRVGIDHPDRVNGARGYWICKNRNFILLVVKYPYAIVIYDTSCGGRAAPGDKETWDQYSHFLHEHFDDPKFDKFLDAIVEYEGTITHDDAKLNSFLNVFEIVTVNLETMPVVFEDAWLTEQGAVTAADQLNLGQDHDLRHYALNKAAVQKDASVDASIRVPDTAAAQDDAFGPDEDFVSSSSIKRATNHEHDVTVSSELETNDASTTLANSQQLTPPTSSDEASFDRLNSSSSDNENASNVDDRDVSTRLTEMFPQTPAMLIEMVVTASSGEFGPAFDALFKFNNPKHEIDGLTTPDRAAQEAADEEHEADMRKRFAISEDRSDGQRTPLASQQYYLPDESKGEKPSRSPTPKPQTPVRSRTHSRVSSIFEFDVADF